MLAASGTRCLLVASRLSVVITKMCKQPVQGYLPVISELQQMQLPYLDPHLCSYNTSGTAPLHADHLTFKLAPENLNPRFYPKWGIVIASLRAMWPGMTN